MEHRRRDRGTLPRAGSFADPAAVAGEGLHRRLRRLRGPADGFRRRNGSGRGRPCPVERPPPGGAGQLGVAAVGLPMFVLAVPGPVVVAVVAVAVAGAGYGLFGVVWTTALQEQVPSEVLGRVAAVDTALGLGAMPLGYLMGGQLAHGIGLHQSLALLAPAAVIAGLAPLAVSSVRRLQPSRNEDRRDGSCPLPNRFVAPASTHLSHRKGILHFCSGVSPGPGRFRASPGRVKAPPILVGALPHIRKAIVDLAYGSIWPSVRGRLCTPKPALKTPK
ncbi:MFS transporter [Streptomyces sp. NPDC048416]|uniref:MFS transporter n=1 Tax=Streptomyces sp. NPDC048416 TaxID=3365546 RepID=UPI00371BF952